MPPRTLALRSGEVHVWRADLNVASLRLRELRQTLSHDELGRAARFRFQEDGERFVVARGLLRTILARYLGKYPGQLRFDYGPHGKPVLDHERAVAALRFNLSHSHDLALFAVAVGAEVGVDVEQMRRIDDAETLAASFFAPHELTTLLSLPLDRRQDAFFACWTRKEAYVKARGDGLTIAPQCVSVSCAPTDPAVLLNVAGHPGESARWTLWALCPDPAYAAALAVEGNVKQLTMWDGGVPRAGQDDSDSTETQ